MHSKKSWYQHLYAQVLLAIVVGVCLGHWCPELGAAMKPFGDGFVKLIKMVIAPIIFCTVVTGISGMGDLKKVGRVGGKALLYFELVTTVALAIGLLAIHLFKPGVGMNVDVRSLNTSLIADYVTPAVPHRGIVEFILHIIPTSIVDAFAKGDILQVLFVSVLFGLSLAMIGRRGRGVVHFVEQCSHGFFGMVALVMKVAPIGAFGAMAFTVGKYGIASLMPLMKLMGVFYLTCFLFIFGVLGVLTRIMGFSIWKFILYIKEELLIVLSTSSSEAVLPRLMLKLEKLGCSKSVVGLVVPTGYSFNLDGTAIYLTMAALFIAQATNTPLTFTQELMVLGILMVTSKGASGVTGSGFIILAATLSAMPIIPVAGLALILGIDRFMSEARALTNTIGNGIATIIISRWEKELDHNKLTMMLNQGEVVEETIEDAHNA